MSNIKYKTRGMVNPKGLPKVYFSCHPSDFERCFETISDEILKNQNCAIFYYENLVEYDKDELFLDLEQMQLFVVPITTNLLGKPNRAMDVELVFAIERHIPVLPIMQERGIEELFNKKFGDLQFLDPYESDITTISYEEKLKKYLSSVLVSDELAAKVRAAFDAYVFLSYRKKDRKYAQELMRLIHKNDFCRDIAIWYDEFLTPGENFNDSIMDALKKSDLFALVVTPNLVNEVNYVMTTEYPLAKKENKLILSAEIVETDKELLKKKYTGIPECTNVHEEKALSERLEKLLTNIAIKENDSSPEHNFFIGLAYLSGIDVEVNHERAVALITSAAEAGVPEAMEKLVSMYLNGEGVERDYATSVKWRKKLAEVYRINCEANPSKNNCFEYLFTLYYLVIGLENIEKIEEAKDVCINLIVDAKKIYDNSEDLYICSFLSKAYCILGRLYNLLNNPENSAKYYNEALKTSEYLVENAPDKYSYAEDLIRSYLSLKTKEFDIKAVSTCENLVEHDDCLSNKSLLARCYLCIAYSYRKEKNYEQELFYYQKALAIRKSLSEILNSESSLYDLSKVYLKLAEFFRRYPNKNYDKSEEYYLESIKISEEVARRTGFFVDRQHLADCYSSYFIFLKRCGKYVDAKEYLLKALRLCEQNAKVYNSFSALEDLAWCFDGLADIYQILKQHKKSEICRIHYFKIKKEIFADYKDVCTQKRLSRLYEEMFEFYEERKPEYAFELFEEQLVILKNIAESTKDTADFSKLSEKYTQIGLFLQEQKIFDKAKTYHLKALQLKKRNALETQTEDDYMSLAVAYIRLGEFNEQQNQMEEAIHYFKQAVDTYIHINETFKTNYSCYRVSIALCSLARTYKKIDDIKMALDMYFCAEKCMKEFMENGGDTSYLWHYASVCMKIGKLQGIRGFPYATERYYRKAIKIYEQYLSTDNIKYKDFLDDLACAYYKFGMLFKGEIRENWLKKSYEIWVSLSEQYPESERYSKNRDGVKSYLS